MDPGQGGGTEENSVYNGDAENSFGLRVDQPKAINRTLLTVASHCACLLRTTSDTPSTQHRNPTSHVGSSLHSYHGAGPSKL